MENGGIYRPELSIDGNFTIVPNAWIRDDELGASAKLLLIYLVSHQVGYEIRDPQIIRETGLGRHALRTARAELEKAGWLTLSRARNADNTLGPYRYELSEARGYFSPVELSPVEDSPVENRPHNKNTNPKNTNLEKNQEIDILFDQFWSVYPRKEAKAAARKRFEKVIKKHDVNVIIAGAIAYRDDPNRELRFTAQAARWLNEERWEDDPLPSNRKKTANEHNMELLRKIQADGLAKAENERKMIDTPDFGAILRRIDD